MSWTPLNTMDDYSPLIDYQPLDAWIQYNSSTDPVADQYFGKTFTYTQKASAQASFSFNGTSLTVYGSKRSDHGNYTVTIDGQSVVANGFTPDPGEFRTPLVERTDLRQGTHIVTIVNMGDGALDVDQVTWSDSSTTTDDNPPIFVDDADADFVWIPEEAWSSEVRDADLFDNGTGRSTSVRNATVRLRFTGTRPSSHQAIYPHRRIAGDAVSLYGTVGPINSGYSVQLDDWPRRHFEGNRGNYATRVLLYQASNLGDGNHTLVISNEDDMNLEIDYALVTRNNLSRLTTSSDDGTTNVPVHGIVASVIGSLVIFGLLLALCCVTRKNRTLWSRLQRGYMVQSQFDVGSPTGTVSVDTVGSGYHVASSSSKLERFESGDYSGTLHHPQPSYSHLQSQSRAMASVAGPLPPVRTRSTLSSFSSASTLVAEDGSNAPPEQRVASRKPMLQVGPSNRRTERRVSQSSQVTLTEPTPPPIPALPSIGEASLVPFPRSETQYTTSNPHSDASSSLVDEPSPVVSIRARAASHETFVPRSPSPVVRSLSSPSWDVPVLTSVRAGTTSPISPSSPGEISARRPLILPALLNRHRDPGVGERGKIALFRTRRPPVY